MKKQTRFSIVLAAVAVLGLAANPAEALLFTGSDQGVNITLDETLSGNLLGIVLTLDTSGYSGPGHFLHGISLKAVNPIELSDITVVDLPGNDGDWTTTLGQISNNSTGPNGNMLGSGSGWFSSLFTADNFGPGVPNGNLVFQYQINLTAGSTTSSVLSEDPFKALYVFDITGNKANGLTSITLTPVPEPGTLLLIGSGLVGLGVGAWRRKKP